MPQGRPTLEGAGSAAPAKVSSEGVKHLVQLAKVLHGGTVREGDGVRLLDVNPEAPRPIRPKLP